MDKHNYALFELELFKDLISNYISTNPRDIITKKEFLQLYEQFINELVEDYKDENKGQIPV